ncbi:hypothetical protein [Rhizohabitans arisaemae]|uniref:hypothetical protein n=1 Tax=Rhizohabitans arisaemae TaxID=2720610 RepID=UPI0024B15630|nr:hypothetical protein [Rhizohabitans arisaemae]
MAEPEPPLTPESDAPAFEVQLRGYSRPQVDEYIIRTTREICTLKERLSTALQATEAMQNRLNAARTAGRSPHEQLSKRLSEIWNLAEEEARQRKADTAEEVERLLAGARKQSDHMLSAAQEQAEEVVERARLESEQVNSVSREQAEQILTSARGIADRILAEAEHRAKVINDDATRRLEQLTEMHAEATRRLCSVRDSLIDLMRRDGATGTLSEMVARLLTDGIIPDLDPDDAAPRVGPAPAQLRVAPGGRPPYGAPARYALTATAGSDDE